MKTPTALLAATLAATTALAAPDPNRTLIPNTSDQWPHWSGPYGHHAAKDCADELVDDVSKARVAWVSEGKFPGPNDCHLDPNTMSSPIVAEDKVFQSYYEYTEEVWDQVWLDKNSKKKKFDKDTCKVLVNDRLHAMDFKTGKKLWDTVLPKKGVNFPNLNWGARMQHVYGEGKVFCQGTSGGVAAVDSRNGKVVWTNAVDKKVLAMFDNLVEKLRNKDPKTTLYSGISRFKGGFATVPAYNDGVVVFGAMGTAYAFDAKTGKTLWQKPGMGGGMGSDIQAFHRPGHKPAVVVAGPKKSVIALDVHTGDELWSVEVENCGNKVSRYGDYIIASCPPQGKPQWGGLAVIKVEKGKGKLLWNNTEASLQRHLVPAVNKGHIFVYGSNQLGHKGGYKLFEFETGKLVKEFWGQIHWRDHHTLQSNDKWYHPYGVLTLDPSDFREIGVPVIQTAADAKNPDLKVEKRPGFPTPTEPKEGGLRFVGYLSPLLVDGYMLCRAPYRVICWDLRAVTE